MKFTSNLLIASAITLSAVALGLATLSATTAPKAHTEHGTIKSLDAADHKLIVSDSKDKAEHKFQWNDQTKFTEHGKDVTATDLKVGDQVRLSYRHGGDMPTLEHVAITPAKAEKHSASTPRSSARSQHA